MATGVIKERSKVRTYLLPESHQGCGPSEFGVSLSSAVFLHFS